MKNEVLQEVTGDWQVKVEIYETFVRKIPKEKEAIIEKIKQSQWGKKLDFKELEREAHIVLNRHIQSVVLIQASSIPLYHLGNPKFEKDGVIIQDKVLMLGGLFQEWEQNHEYAKITNTIQDFVDLNLLFWEYGLFELSFNFTLNNGFDSDGNLIFVDLGEFTNNEGLIQRNLDDQVWKHCWSVRNNLEEKMRDYYIEMAHDKFTYGNFKKLWQKKCT